MTESDIQKILLDKYWLHPHRLCNTFMFPWESDFFSITRDGYTYEIEIKCSRADFFNDFKKPKHRLLGSRGRLFVEGDSRVFHDWDHKTGITAEYCHLTIVDPTKALWPNRFFFCCPEGLISAADVPAYAGLLWVVGNKIVRVKQPMQLHSRKMNFTEKLMNKYYWDNQRLAKENAHIKGMINYWKTKYEEK